MELRNSVQELSEILRETVIKENEDSDVTEKTSLEN